MCKNFSNGIGFERMKRAWTTANTWDCESSQENIGEDAASIAVDNPRVERWYGEGIMSEQKRRFVKVQPENTLAY